VEQVQLALEAQQRLHTEEGSVRDAELRAELEAERREGERLQGLLHCVMEESQSQQDRLTRSQSDVEMASQMWRAQADEAMTIAQKGAQHEQLLAQELERVRQELEQYQGLAGDTSRLRARLEAAEQAEARAVAARAGADEEVAHMRGAVKRVQRQKEDAEAQWSSQLSRAKHTIESLQRREQRIGSVTSLDISAQYSP